MRTHTHAELKALPKVASGIIPDGYNGGELAVTWRYCAENQCTVTEYLFGPDSEEPCFYTAPLPDADSPEESLWLLNNHINAHNWRIDP